MIPQPDITLSFTTLPTTSLWVLLRRHRGKELPVIQATCSNITPFDVQRYNKVCNFPTDMSNVSLTYPQLLAAPLHYQIITHPQFPFPAIGLVHVEQHITSHLPISTESAVTITTWCNNLHQVRSGYQFSLHTKVFLENKKLAWEGESIVLTRSLPGHKKQRSDKGKPENIDYRIENKIVIPENMGRQYARISKDWNLIHVHWVFAKMFGFQRAIVHGMWTLAKAISWGTEQGLQINKCHARFLRPVLLPSTVTLALQENEKKKYIHILRNRDQKINLDIEIQN